MSDVSIVPANEGTSVINEQKGPEIKATELEIKEKYQVTASAVEKPLEANITDKSVTSAITPIESNQNTQKEYHQENLDFEDAETIKGRYGFMPIATYIVPYIFRKVNGNDLKFVSVKMAESQLLYSLMHYLHPNIYSCRLIKSYYITDSEAKLLNYLNQEHCDSIFGNETINPWKDTIVLMEDLKNFYTFIEVCAEKLQSNIPRAQKEICGFIRINSESVVPYCTKDGQKYVPLFYFEGETESFSNQVVKLENWDLAYLKFCFMVQGIKDELFDTKSCTVTSLKNLENHFPPDTHFEEYWPIKVVDTKHLLILNYANINPASAWIITPPNVELAPEKIILQTNTELAQITSQGMSMMKNTYQKEWPANKTVNSCSTQEQPLAEPGYSIRSENQNKAVWCDNTDFTMISQGSNSRINVSKIVQPLPIAQAGNTVPVIDNLVSYNEPMIPMYNLMINSTVRSDSNQMIQLYNASQLQQQQQQQHGCLTNTQQQNASMDIGPVINTAESGIIDLTTPPSSPIIETSPSWELLRLPEPVHGKITSTSNSAAYKIQKTTFQDKVFHGINYKAFMYSHLMITLDDLVQQVFPTCSVSICADILYNQLNIKLYCGNSVQLTVLWENRCITSKSPEDTPMVLLQDIMRVFLDLKSKLSEQPLQYQSVSWNGQKRQRTR